jgi:Cu2+-exporting ATPase
MREIGTEIVNASGSGFVAAAGRLRAAERAAVQAARDGRALCLLSVPGIRCGGCVATIERALTGCPGIVSARANLSLQRVRLTLANAGTDPRPAIERLESLGYTAIPIEPAGLENGADARTAPGLLRAIAVAGFGAMNIMLLSVAVWSGADENARATFHLISAAIAVPVVAYAGQPFFRSALSALRGGRLNMDVPIALAVILALALSLFETARGGEQAFFDAAVTLLFFLLIGRYMDQRMRDRARSAVAGLARLLPTEAMVRREDGSLDHLPIGAIVSGMVLHIPPGDRVPVDARIVSGTTDLDRSLVTGEAMPVAAGPGAVLESGTLNLTGGIEAAVIRPAQASFLAEMMRSLNAAETSRSTYVRVADRVARLYAPVVHLLALATFAGWTIVGADWQRALFVAISVLIITCPCALGLAVPVAHVVAAGRLMRAGIMMKDGSALERLAQIDCAVFDKTGTLTTGQPAAAGGPDHAPDRAAAMALAGLSLHPAARAIAAALEEPAARPKATREVPGFGVEGLFEGRLARLGRASWVSEIAVGGDNGEGPDPAFAFAGGPVSTFVLAESLRPHARDAVKSLEASGVPATLLSGDSAARAEAVAAALGIRNFRHGLLPAGKVAFLDDLRRAGHRPLMVGDGLNDTSALTAAHVSMTPASAADPGRAAADFVFLRDGLDAVPRAYEIARQTARRVRQNIGIAIIYNCVAIPLAVIGQVTPLIAALAMSASSIVVIANSLRLDAPASVGRTARLRTAMVPA